MAVTAYKYPGTAANVGNGGYGVWSSCNNAKADDTSYATLLPGKYNSDYLSLTNFGFSSSDIPAGATINGIEFIISRYYTDANEFYDTRLYLLKDGAQHGSNLASASKWPNTITDATYGGSANLCGGTWSQADILDADFGVQLAGISSEDSTDHTAYVDYIKIRVYYTEAGGVTIPVFMYHYTHH